jgi:hypothetical protein
MYAVVHDVAAFHQRLNKQFAEFGVHLRSEDLLVPEFRCVALGTDQAEIEQARTILHKEGIAATVTSVAIGLDWAPMLYYLCVPEGNVSSALAWLGVPPRGGMDLSRYLKGLTISRSRSERRWVRVALLLIAVWSVGVGILAVLTARQGRWDLAVLSGVLMLLFVGCGYMAFRASQRSSSNR